MTLVWVLLQEKSAANASFWKMKIRKLKSDSYDNSYVKHSNKYKSIGNAIEINKEGKKD